MIRALYSKKHDGFSIYLGDEPCPIEVWSDTKGFQHLKCPCWPFQEKSWCDHVEKIMTFGVYHKGNGYKREPDANTLGAAVGTIVFNKPCLIIPTLVLPKSGGTSEFARVEVLWGEISKSSGLVQAGGNYSLGFIHRGVEGRATIRRMILEWLVVVPQLFADEMECDSSAHRQGDSVLDRGVTLNGDPVAIQKRTMIDAYQLLDTGMCRKCYEASDINLPF